MKQPREEKSLLAQLNEQKDRKFPDLKKHTPKANQKKPYAYAYFDNESEARKMALWLIKLNIVNELHYVPTKQKYLVSIPFIDTYAHDYLQKFVLEGSHATASELIQQGAASASARLTSAFFAMHEALILLAKAEYDYKRIRKQDMVQTSFFKIQKNYANSGLINHLVDSHNSFESMIGAFENWCKNNEIIDLNCTDLERKIIAAAKLRNANVEHAQKKVSSDLDSAIKKWIEVSTSELKFRSSLYQMDNDIYTNWLFINKQLENLSDGSIDNHNYFSEQFEAFKKSIMDLANSVTEQITQRGNQLYPINAAHYVQNLFEFELGMLSNPALVARVKTAKASFYTKAEEDRQFLDSISKQTATVKKQISDCAREAFLAKNTVNKTAVKKV